MLHFMKSIFNFFRNHLKLFLLYLPLVTSLLIGIFIFVIYMQWIDQRDSILNKLKDYKRFIDYTEDLQDGFVFGGYFSAGVKGTAIGIPSKIFDKNGVLIGEFFSEKREVIPLKKIPKNIIASVIANEDADFLKHTGVNVKAIVRAIGINLLTMSYRQGGSTLTQQLAKVLFTEGKKTIKRKIFEAFCAMEIERNYDKQDILTMYLNLIYFGRGAFGVEEAAKTYFNKSAQHLSLGEAAMLVGLIPNPAFFNPLQNIRIAFQKAQIVLNRLIEVKSITAKQKSAAVEDLKRVWNIQILSNHPHGGKSLIGTFSKDKFRNNRAPHFNERLRRILIQNFDETTLKQNGLKIYTTLDIVKQQAAEKIITAFVDSQKKYHLDKALYYQKHRQNQKANTEKEKAGNINGAFISINPVTGEIEAYIAGYEFSSKNQLDRVSQIRRQPGSSFKPFIYLAGIEEKKITIASIFEDKKINIGGYAPGNYDNEYRGKISTRDALRLSINTVAVQVLNKTGFSKLFEILQSALDLSDKEMKSRFQQNLSLALGTAELSPLEHVRLHAMLSNGGKYIIPHGIRYVEDYGGKVILDQQKIVAEKMQKRQEENKIQIISPQSAYILTQMLSSYFEPGVYGYEWRKKAKIDFEIGGKTGTSSNYVDVWFAGHTPNLVTSLWMGNDSGNISLGPGRSGGALMAPAWVNYISAIRYSFRHESYKKPKEGLVFENVCSKSGLVPRSGRQCQFAIMQQPFLEGTEPGNYCPLHP